MNISNKVIYVVDEPYCIWDHGLESRNLELLQGLDGGYFEYIALKCAEDVDSQDNNQYAATLLRTAYYHGLETLFAYIGALIQAPKCVYGWLLKYRPGDISILISKIDTHDSSLHTVLNIDTVTWKNISKLIFESSSTDQVEAQQNIDLYATLWSRLATEYLRDYSDLEYNSIKHGFRIRPGGFSLRYGLEPSPGVLASPETMKTLTQSQFGSSLFSLEPTPKKSKGNRSYRSRQRKINWSFDRTAAKVLLISISINNIVSMLKILNGIEPSSLNFCKPHSMEAFDYPWTHTTENSQISFDYVYPQDRTLHTSKEDLHTLLRGDTKTQ